MVNIALYLVTVLIWGTTWMAIKLQLGVTAVEVSIVLRFALAAAVLFVALVAIRKLQRLALSDHLFCVLQGACLFCFNFYAFYTATAFVTSGLVAVVFSLATVFNSINGWIWFRRTPTKRVLSGAALGVMGVALMFLPELQRAELNEQLLYGLGLAALGTYFFSSGNMISVRHQQKGLRPPSTNAWSMVYGVMIMCSLLWLQDIPWQVDTSVTYWSALFYLAIPGTVIAFTTYLLLVGRLGADSAAYCTVMFPAVALTVSTVLEGYQWTLPAVIGFTLVLLGNGVIFAKLPAAWSVRRLARS